MRDVGWTTLISATLHLLHESQVPTLHVQLGEFTVPLEVTVQAEETSGHTGRTLTVVRGRVDGGDEALHDAFMRALEAQPVEGVELARGRSASARVPGDRRWKLTRKSHSMMSDGRGGPMRYSYALELREAEHLVPERLEVGAEPDRLVLAPYYYAEELSAGALLIRCRVQLTGEACDALRRFVLSGPTYFPVVRHGVSDVPRQMRFGRTTWSRHDGGEKYSLYLLEQAYDVANPSAKRGLPLADDSARTAAAFQASVLDGLVARLEAKGVLDGSEVATIREEAGRALTERRFELFARVDDVDEED